MAPILYIGDTDASCPCRAVCMTVKAAGIEVDLKRVGLSTGETQSDWFKKINPLGCLPTIDDDGFKLWESRTILRYLVDKFAKDDSLYPKDLQQRACVDRMLDGDCDGYGVIKAYVYPQLFALQPADAALKEKNKMFLSKLNEHAMLSAGKYLTGDSVTIADISVLASLSFLEAIDWDFSPYTNITAWKDKMHQHSWFQEVNKGFEEFVAFSKTPTYKEMIEASLKK